jgi:spore coat protein A
MQPLRQKLHRDLPATRLWDLIAVQWRNNLPTGHHPLPYDDTLHGDEPGVPQIRTVVHLHGHKVLPDSDGYPEAWFTNGFARTGPAFETRHHPPQQLHGAAGGLPPAR